MLSWRKLTCSEYGSQEMSMLMEPLPEIRSASLLGMMLQKPRRGTIRRRIRSSKGIGTIFTPER